MTTTAILRSLTLNERLYVIGEALSPPFLIQIAIKGNGVLNPADLKDALERLHNEEPVLHLFRHQLKWRIRNSPVIIHVHEMPFPSDLNVETFKRPLPKYETVGWHLFIDNGQSTILMRISHTIVDGKGAFKIMEKLFQILHGGHTLSASLIASDEQVRRDLVKGVERRLERLDFSWPGLTLSQNRVSDYISASTTVEHDIVGLLSKIACTIARYHQRACRILIPVDLRRHASVPNSSSNLTFPVFLDVESSDNWRSVEVDLLKQLQAKCELQLSMRFTPLAKAIPLSWLQQWMNCTLRWVARKDMFPITAVITDLGRTDLMSYSTPTFSASDVIFIPVQATLSPVCISICRYNNKTAIVVNTPKTSQGEDFIAFLFNELSIMESEITNERNKSDSNIDDNYMMKLVMNSWSKHLSIHVSEINPDKTFFDLGGDSILLLETLSELASTYTHHESEFLDYTIGLSAELTVRSLAEALSKFAKQ